MNYKQPNKAAAGSSKTSIIMKTFNDYIKSYRQQLQQGDIQVAYRKLIEYMMTMKTHFKNEYPGYAVSSNIYQGYMDVTHFSFTPPQLRKEKLKVVIVFIHPQVRFDIWLAGLNRKVQKQYWDMFKGSDWDKYRIPESIDDVFSIVEHTLVEQPDFDHLGALTRQIENETVQFITDIAVLFE